MRLMDQGVGAFGVVVGSLLLGASAGEVELPAEAVGPLPGVGLAGDVECHQLEQLREPVAVRQASNAVAIRRSISFRTCSTGLVEFRPLGFRVVTWARAIWR